MPDLAPGVEDDSEPPSLEMTDDIDGFTEEDIRMAYAGTGSNAHLYSNSRHSSADGGRLNGQYAAGINRNSRIWHVPDDVDQHQHSLGPAPGHEDDSMHSFPLPTVQFMGPGGGGMVVSVPVPHSLAAITGLPGLSALMGHASNSRQQEPLFLPGGGLGRPVFRHNRGHNRNNQHPGSSSDCASRGSGFASNRESVVAPPLDSSHTGRFAFPVHATAGTHASMVQLQVPGNAAAPATRTDAGPPLGPTAGSTGSTGAVSFLASGAAALQSAEVFAAAGAGQVPAVLLPEQQQQQQSPGRGHTSAALEQHEATPRYSPWARGRYMLHARRTRTRRTSAQGGGSTPAAATASLGEPFRFAAVPVIPAAPPASAQAGCREVEAELAPVLEASTAAAPAGFSQAPHNTTQVQKDGHFESAACSSSSTPPQRSSSFQFWPPWCLLASGIRVLHRLVFGSPRSSSVAAATATASIINAGHSTAATAAAHLPTEYPITAPCTAARSHPASFRLTIPTELGPSAEASPVGAAGTNPAMPVVDRQHPQLSRRWQQREAARATRQRRRRQQQPAEDSDNMYIDTCDPVNAASAASDDKSSDNGSPDAAAATTAPAWQSSFPQVPGSSVWTAGIQSSAGAAHSPSAVAATNHPTSRPSQPVSKRGRVEAVNAESSSSSLAAAAPAPAVTTPAAVSGSSTGPSSSAAAGAPTNSLHTPVRYNTSWPVSAAPHVSGWQELTPAVGLPERRTTAVATRLNVGARPAASAAAAAHGAAGATHKQQQQQQAASEGGDGNGSSSDSDSRSDLPNGATVGDMPLSVEPHTVSHTSASPVPSLCSESSEDERCLLAAVDSAFGHSTADPSCLVGQVGPEHGSEFRELVSMPAEQHSAEAASNTRTQQGPAGGLGSNASIPNASGLDPQPGSSPPPLLDDPESSVDGSGSDSDDSIPALEVSQDDSSGSEPYSEDDHTSEASGSGDSDHSSQDGSDGLATDCASSDSDSNGSMPHLEADSEDESATAGQVGTRSTAATAPREAATVSRGSSRQQGVQNASISSHRGSDRGQSHSSGLRAGFLGGRLEQTTWTTEPRTQQQQRSTSSRPTDGLRGSQRTGDLAAELSPFLQMLHLSAMTYAALGGGTDNEDSELDEDEDEDGVDDDDDDDDDSEGASSEGSEGGWETASNQSSNAIRPAQHHSTLANTRAAGSVADVTMGEHGPNTRRDGHSENAAAAVPFGRPRSNAFVVPSSIGRELQPDAGTMVRDAAAATPSVKGLPVLERPKATKLLKPSAVSSDSKTALSSENLLVVSAAEAARKRTARLLQDAAYTRQLLQNLPGVDISNPGIESVLKMLESRIYTLALAATKSRDGKRLIPHEEYAFTQNLERSRIMLSRWRTSH